MPPRNDYLPGHCERNDASSSRREIASSLSLLAMTFLLSWPDTTLDQRRVTSKISVALRQRIQQCFGVLQIRCLKAFSKPVIDRGQQVSGFHLLVLLLPQPGQARRGAEFQGFRLLGSGNIESLVETRLGLHFTFACSLLIFAVLREQKLALQSMQLSFVTMLRSFIHEFQGLDHGLRSVLVLPHFPIRLCQQGQIAWFP